MSPSDKYILRYAIGYLKWLLPYAACEIESFTNEQHALRNHLDKIRKFIEENEKREYRKTEGEVK